MSPSFREISGFAEFVKLIRFLYDRAVEIV